ncbi:MAG TPA: hypothetical protein VFV49_10870, partial [Thermoanaerobaculia bacterium]|nr:hypothetical protein [Thermoanaerobaculia bacterium]
MSETPVTPETVQEAFPSIIELRSMHTSLLAQQRRTMSVTELADEARLFVRRARLTGVYLDAEEQRTAAQGLIDYWSTTLIRASVEVPDTTLAEFDSSYAPTFDDALCPYVGLTAFREKDSRHFFGRKRAVDAALSRMKDTHFVGVTGSSGSGKSSIVRAGLIPALKAGALDDSASWTYLTPVTPGTDPLLSLASALEEDAVAAHALAVQLRRDVNAFAVAAGERTLVFTIDQLEELFTLCDDHEVRVAFAQNLVALAAAGRSRVIVTMRSDYEYRLTTLPELQKLYSAGRVEAKALDDEELREAIEKPAAMIELKLEAGLTEALIEDVRGEASALPLLQFTLWKLWEARDHNRLTLAAYRKLGGGLAALARSADELFHRFSPQSGDTMRRVLLRMVRAAAGAELTSSRVRVSALRKIGDDPARVQDVLDKLEKARLIRRTEGKTADDDMVEVAHEALIRNWPMLVGWLETKRGGLMELRRLEALADEWLRFGRRGGFLDKEQLEDAEEWLRSDEAQDLSASESLLELVAASRTLIDKQQQTRRLAKGLVV